MLLRVRRGDAGVRAVRRRSASTHARSKKSSSALLDEPLRIRQGKDEFAESRERGVLERLEGRRNVTDQSVWTVQALMDHLMPRDYKRTTGRTYESYAKATMVSSAFGTAASVLSMQALLTSVGVSSASVLPLAATLNWVLKDGLGQLGGIFFASKVNTRFDADPKRFRFGADVGLALSVTLESCTALTPWLFLPMASLANVGKNVSWLSASATRASIHQSFCLEHNLADVTGKAGSQTITASIAGTALGIMLSPLCGHNAMRIIAGTAILSLVQLVISYRALHFVQLKNLNIQRAWLCLSPALLSFRFKDAQSSLCALDWERLDSPESVSKKERILHFGRWGTRDGRARLVSPTSQLQEDGFVAFLMTTFTFQPYLKSSLHVNPSVTDFPSSILRSV